MHILGIVLVILGAILIAIGWNSSRKITEKMMHGVTGHFTQHTTWYMIGGIFLIALGAILALLDVNHINP